MNETITVDEALRKGHKIVTYPGIAIMFGMLGISFYLGMAEIMPIWIIPVGLVSSFIVAWLYWSVMITRWRLWAFENVRNVHELKKRAVQEKLIWGDSSVFEKTEIRKSVDKEKWSMLQGKFKQEDVFADDINIPSETLIFYSKIKNYFEMIIMLGCFGVGLYMLFVSDSYWLSAALTLIGASFAVKEFKQATNTIPQVILNDKGMQTISTPFYKWSEISNEEVVSEGEGKYVRFYLAYNHPDGKEKLLINDFTTEQRALEKLMQIYRGRNKEKSN